jgi:hypothetical protein
VVIVRGSRRRSNRSLSLRGRRAAVPARRRPDSSASRRRGVERVVLRGRVGRSPRAR